MRDEYKESNDPNQDGTSKLNILKFRHCPIDILKNYQLNKKKIPLQNVILLLTKILFQLDSVSKSLTLRVAASWIFRRILIYRDCDVAILVYQIVA